MPNRGRIILASSVAAIGTAVNGAHALRAYIAHWFSTPAEHWVVHPRDALATWTVIAASATVVSLFLTSSLVLARRRKVAVLAVALVVPLLLVASILPVELFGLMLPLHSYAHEGVPGYVYWSPGGREAFAAPLSVLLALAAFALVPTPRSHEDADKGSRRSRLS